MKEFQNFYNFQYYHNQNFRIQVNLVIIFNYHIKLIYKEKHIDLYSL